MATNDKLDDAAGGIVLSDEARSARSVHAIAGAEDRNASAGDAYRRRSPEPTGPPEGSEPVRWVGTKGGEGVWQRIISEMPPHTVFVDAFAGRGTIARAKKPASRSIVIDSDPAAPALQLPGTIALCGDVLKLLPSLLPQMDSGWLIYLDPPYLAEVRSDANRDYYAHEFKQPEQHFELLKRIRLLPCQVMISGYWSDLYRRVLADWRTIEIPTSTRGGGRATEVVWMNFCEPFRFHDSRFLGRNFRERERIKRKRIRWKAKLSRMSRLDRAAVLDAIDELVSETESPNHERNA